MRILLLAGAAALAAGTILFGGAVAAQAAPTGAVTVEAGRLVLEPGEYGHTGSLRIAIGNPASEPFNGSVTITEPIPAATTTIDGAGGCVFTGTTPDNRTISSCVLDTIPAGETGVVTVGFQSPAKPQPYAQVAPQRGSVEVAGATANFPALFRSTNGSLRHPRPYVQDTTGSLTVTTPGDVTLTQQPDGSFAGRVPVTVYNNGDAPHRYLNAEVAIPAGLDKWPGVEGVEGCSGASQLPTPPGGNAMGCSVAGDQLAEGQTRTFAWILTAPAGTPAGPLGTGTTLVNLSGPAVQQSDAANIDTFTITVAG